MWSRSRGAGRTEVAAWHSLHSQQPAAASAAGVGPAAAGVGPFTGRQAGGRLANHPGPARQTYLDGNAVRGGVRQRRIQLRRDGQALVRRLLRQVAGQRVHAALGCEVGIKGWVVGLPWEGRAGRVVWVRNTRSARVSARGSSVADRRGCSHALCTRLSPPCSRAALTAGISTPSPSSHRQ